MTVLSAHLRGRFLYITSFDSYTLSTGPISCRNFNEDLLTISNQDDNKHDGEPKAPAALVVLHYTLGSEYNLLHAIYLLHFLM